MSEEGKEPVQTKPAEETPTPEIEIIDTSSMKQAPELSTPPMKPPQTKRQMAQQAMLKLIKARNKLLTDRIEKEKSMRAASEAVSPAEPIIKAVEPAVVVEEEQTEQPVPDTEIIKAANSIHKQLQGMMNAHSRWSRFKKK